MRVITAHAQLIKGMRAMQRALIGQAEDRGELQWAFPSGGREICRTYALQTGLGEMLFAIPSPWDGRQAHMFRLGFERGTLFPDAEINIPDGLDRSVSGVLAVGGKGRIMICHRGAVTAFRGKVRTRITLDHFQAWLQEVDDDGRSAQVIAISSTDSSTIAEDIAEFVFEVKRLKDRLKAESRDDYVPDEQDEPAAGWGEQEEYEGDKSYSPTPGKRDYPYLHGPLCNSLHRKLKELAGGSVAVKVLKNRNIDLALVDRNTGKARAIFEVKTSASLSAQLYTAFGQLSYYQHRFGTEDTERYLVLPAHTASDFTAGEFFDKANVHVLFGEAGSFETTDGASLEKVLNSVLN
ncbi:hypothetical protein [Pseudomonas poae]|uniref:hypothetical protein n=1 Tax=Pseudomonas poae TaxID=200451 RepID=UPI00147276F1|nr:hypothetical protein [Pseudomonas poae]NMZ49523.1 hypothetical protein [Pseudomonas poae]